MLTWLSTTTLGKLTATFIISMVPIIELRLGLPYGIALGLDYTYALCAAVLGNMIPVPFIILFIQKIFQWIRKRIKALDGFVSRLEQRADHKGELVEKYGPLALILLVGIPLPGTGAWTGSLVAALLNVPIKKAVPSIFIGVCLAAAIMTAVTYGLIKLV